MTKCIKNILSNSLFTSINFIFGENIYFNCNDRNKQFNLNFQIHNNGDASDYYSRLPPSKILALQFEPKNLMKALAPSDKFEVLQLIIYEFKPKEIKIQMFDKEVGHIYVTVVQAQYDLRNVLNQNLLIIKREFDLVQKSLKELWKYFLKIKKILFYIFVQIVMIFVWLLETTRKIILNIHNLFIILLLLQLQMKLQKRKLL